MDVAVCGLMHCLDLSRFPSVFSLFSLGALQHSKIWMDENMPLPPCPLLPSNVEELFWTGSFSRRSCWESGIWPHQYTYLSLKTINLDERETDVPSNEFQLISMYKGFGTYTVDILKLGEIPYCWGRSSSSSAVKNVQQCPWPWAITC